MARLTRYLNAFNKHWTITEERISWVWDKQPSAGYSGLQLSGSADRGTPLYDEWLADLDREASQK